MAYNDLLLCRFRTIPLVSRRFHQIHKDCPADIKSLRFKSVTPWSAKSLLVAAHTLEQLAVDSEPKTTTSCLESLMGKAASAVPNLHSLRLTLRVGLSKPLLHTLPLFGRLRNLEVSMWKVGPPQDDLREVGYLSGLLSLEVKATSPFLCKEV